MNVKSKFSFSKSEDFTISYCVELILGWIKNMKVLIPSFISLRSEVEVVSGEGK